MKNNFKRPFQKRSFLHIITGCGKINLVYSTVITTAKVDNLLFLMYN